MDDLRSPPHRREGRASGRASTWRDSLATAATALAAGVLVLQTYLLLHEGGHVLAGWLQGGTLIDVQVEIWDARPHIGFLEPFSGWRQGVISVAGTLVPLVAWAAFIVLAPKRTGMPIAMLKVIASAGVVNSLLPWIVLPLLNDPPAGDDVTRFLEHSGAPPWSVALAFLGLYAASVALFFVRIPGPKAFFATFTQREHREGNTRVGIGLAVGALVAMAIAGWISGPADRATREPVAAVDPVVHVELADRAHRSDVVYEFATSVSTVVRFQAVIAGVRTGPFALELAGDKGIVRSLFRGAEDVTIGRATVDTGPIPLDPGAYRILLTAVENPGTVSVAVVTSDTSREGGMVR